MKSDKYYGTLKSEVERILNEGNKKLNTGIFSGSFNPVHIGHLALANWLCEFAGLDEVWLVITPPNLLIQSIRSEHWTKPIPTGNSTSSWGLTTGRSSNVGKSPKC